MLDTCCPKCGSRAFKRNGYTRHAKQNHRCLDCGRQFSVEIAQLVQELDPFPQAEPPLLTQKWFAT